VVPDGKRKEEWEITKKRQKSQNPSQKRKVSWKKKQAGQRLGEVPVLAGGGKKKPRIEEQMCPKGPSHLKGTKKTSILFRKRIPPAKGRKRGWGSLFQRKNHQHQKKKRRVIIKAMRK